MTTKANWKAAKAEVEAIENERAALLAPTKERYEIAQQRLSDIEDEFGGAHLGDCLLCAEPIFEGEPYHSGADGDPCCQACSPTWRDMLTGAENFRDTETDEPLTPEQAKVRVDAHLAAGGSLDDKMVSA